jgi:hypothetical protein
MTDHLPTDLPGEEFSQREPLTTRLRGLVRSYPKGVGLIHEFVQNADDAGARSVRVILDEGTYPSTRLPTTSMAELQGPAIVVVNDASFSDEDWRNIQQIGQSGKELDTTKTGRFGLGFNSVYNVTEFPTLLTGNRIGIFDPHGRTVAGATQDRPGRAWRLEPTLWSKYPDVLAPFQKFGLAAGASTFNGSLFRLPLRTVSQAATSEICEQPFTAADFDSIVEKLTAQVGDILLFLKNVQDIEVSRIDQAGRARELLSARTINREEVDAARDRIRRVLALDHTSLLASLSGTSSAEVVSEFEHEIEINTGSQSKRHDKFLIIYGLFADAAGKIADCARQMFKLNEKAVPLAGAAAKLGPSGEDSFKGRLFCTLPLPISSPVPSCHVNGFFDLQADRQGLFQDPGAGGGSAVRVSWNRLLLEHACSEAVARLCLRRSHEAKTSRSPLYDHWPRVPAQEGSLLDQLPRLTFGCLRSLECIAAGGESAWHLPRDVKVLPGTVNENVEEALLAASFAIPNPSLPGFVLNGFAAAGATLVTLTPALLRAALRVPADPKCPVEKAPRPCLAKPAWVRALLEYCLSDGKVDDLLGVPLALMSNGVLRAFGRDPNALVFLAGKEERALFIRTSSWFIDPGLETLPGLRESKAAGVLRFSPQHVLINLVKVLPTPQEDGRIAIATSGDAAPSQSWLVQVFEYLAGHAREIQPDEHFKKIPLLPDQFGYLNVMGMADTPLLPTTEDPKGLLAALTAARVPLVSGTEDVLKAIRSFVDAFPDLAAWRLSPGDLIDTLSAVAEENGDVSGTLTHKHASALLDYLATPRGVKELGGPRAADRVPALKALRLFPSTSGQLVRLSEGDHHIPASYDLPKVDIELGLLDCGRDQRWIPMYQALGVPTLTKALLLTSLLLPRMDDLSSEDIHNLLVWLRHHLHSIREEVSKEAADTLVRTLGAAVPVRCTDGQSRASALLYHPDVRFVADLLGDGVGFPDLETYSDRPDLWLELFETLGMAKTPRPDDIVDAIDETLASNRPVEDKVTAIARIAEYLEEQWEQLKDRPVEFDDLQPPDSDAWHLSDALSLRAWLPALRTAPRDYPKGLLLEPTSDFYKPSDMLAREAINLAGSVRPICRLWRLSRLQASVGLQTEPTLDDVLTHFENALALPEAEKSPVTERLTSVFHRVYDFLGRTFIADEDGAIESDPRLEAIRARFESHPCLVDADRRLWLPGHCFEESVARFLGRRAQVRFKQANHDRGVRVLGRRTRPVAQDFVDLFDELSDDLGARPVPDADRSLVRSAYESAASLAGEETFTESPMLLESGKLVLATDAVLDDAPWLSERAHAAGMLFQDSGLGELVARAFGVRLLSSAVFERPQSERPSRDTEFVQECASLQSRLRSSQMRAGVQRLLIASGVAVRSEDLRRFFAQLRVIPVADLQTTLVWMDGDIPVEGSQGACDVVFDPGRNAVIVSEDAKEVLYERIGLILGTELRLDGHDLGETATHFVATLRVEPEAIDRHLTKLRVRALPPSVDTDEPAASESDGFIDAEHAGEHDDSEPAEESSNTAQPGKQNAGVAPSTRMQPTTFQPPPGQSPTNDAAELDQDVSDDKDAHSATGAPATASKSDSPQAPTKRGVQDPQSAPERPPTGGSDESKHVGGERLASAVSDGKQTGRARATGRPTDLGKGDLSQASPKNRGGPDRDEQSRTQRGRARTYVAPRDGEKDQEPPERQDRRRRVDQAAVQRVLQFERDRGRRPKEMPHANEGYDIESFSGGSKLERLIEVKGLSGAWTDYGVPISRSQFRKALKEGPTFWLYVVEFALEPNRARIYAIQDPAELVDEFWFDGGWREFAKERGGPGVDATIKKGSLVLIDGGRRGTIKNIHKHGVLMHLDVEFEDHSRDRFVYSPRRVQILPDEEAAP